MSSKTTDVGVDLDQQRKEGLPTDLEARAGENWKPRGGGSALLFVLCSCSWPSSRVAWLTPWGVVETQPSAGGWADSCRAPGSQTTLLFYSQTGSPQTRPSRQPEWSSQDEKSPGPARRLLRSRWHRPARGTAPSSGCSPR